jgi:hypothetical protein
MLGYVFMPTPNIFFGLTVNPLNMSPFVTNNGDVLSQPIPPPGSDFMITEIGSLLMTDESGNFMITE